MNCPKSGAKTVAESAAPRLRSVFASVREGSIATKIKTATMIEQASNSESNLTNVSANVCGPAFLLQSGVKEDRLFPFWIEVVLTIVTLGLTIAFAFKLHADLKNYQRSVSIAPCLMVGCIYWLSWVFVFAVSSKFSPRWSDDKQNFRIQILMHLLVGVLISVLIYLLLRVSFYSFYQLAWLPRHDISRFTIVLNLAIYVAMIGALQATYLWNKSARLKERQIKLQADLANSQLQALKMQLQPHFLFNALNTIRMLIETEPVKAVRMTTLLGEFLRVTLESTQEDEVTLGREMTFVQSFLDIQKIRFEERISTEMVIEKGVADLLVPNLILQPIVENAFVHGCGKSPRPGKIEIHAMCRDEELVIKIHDSGSGADSVYSERTGLNITRSRLNEHYGRQAEFGISQNDDGGTTVTLRLPARLNTDPYRVLRAT